MPSIETGYVPFDAGILQRLAAAPPASSQAAEGHSGIIAEGSIR